MKLVIFSATECWEKVPTLPAGPQPRSQMAAFVLPELRCGGGDLSGLAAVPSTPSLARHARAVAGRIKEEAENILDSRHAGTRYSFYLLIPAQKTVTVEIRREGMTGLRVTSINSSQGKYLEI